MTIRRVDVAVTRERVHARTQEFAVRAGRRPPQVSQADYEQAKREVTGETEIDRQYAALDAIPDISTAAEHANARKMIQILHEEILRRAYAIWQREGNPENRQFANWLAAEAEVTVRG